ncbi:MAG: hypothetical protein ACYCUM_04495 [Solirubrobacteraceae bacterium]
MRGLRASPRLAARLPTASRRSIGRRRLGRRAGDVLTSAIAILGSVLPGAAVSLALAANASARLAVVSLALAANASASAAPTASVSATLRPKIPGASTTISMTIVIVPNGTIVPPPLLAAQVSYPAGLDVQLSGLGIASCGLAPLEALGPEGCPPDSVMGRGSAIAQVPIDGGAVSETARLAIVRAAERDGHLALMLVAYDEPALSAQIVLPAELLPADGPFGGRLAIDVPLVPTFPEGPDISVSQIKLVLGPAHLRYRERVHGRVVHYEPAGIKLPGRCTHGGYRFAVQLSFLGGEEASATSAVPCPRRPSQGRRSR